MRNGVAAIVPLFFSIVILFSFIMFMGGASESLQHVSELEHVKNVEKRIVTAAMIMKIDLLNKNHDLNVPLTESQMNTIVSDRISLMVDNSTK